MSVGGSSEAGNESKGGQLDPQLLLASLLEEKCRLSTKDTNYGQQLFKELTAHLCNLGILTQDSSSDEYMDLRFQQRKMLSDIILKKAKDFPVLLIYDVRELLELGRLQNSRYKNEFQELDKLGKGGFGSVFKARHILDGNEYAVKKIRLRSSSKKIKLLREVKALAYLKHNNIVCYNTAWTEEYDSNISPENGSSSSSQEDSADHHPQDIDLIIYIQMELCASNLQDWLRERNTVVSNSGDNSSLLSSITHSVIQQILIGVAYIHANGLVHRDLKPKNIFLSGGDNDPQVKIGDFGLAKDLMKGDYEGGNLIPTTQGLPDFSNNTKNVGTELYASPEQLGSTEYDFKSDMYSVGIILYEMSNVFTTDMERFIKIGELRQKNKCSETFQQKSPIEAEIIDALINPVASERPSAGEVLSHPLFMPKDQRQLARLLQTVDQQGQQMMGLRDKLTAAASLVDAQTWTLSAVTQLVRSTENPDLNSRFGEIMSSRSIYDPLSAELMREG